MSHTKSTFPKTFTKLSLAAIVCMMGQQAANAQSALDYASRWRMDDCGTTTAMANDVLSTAVAVRGSSVQCTADPAGKAKGAAMFTVSRGGDGIAATNVTVNDTSGLFFTNSLAVSIIAKPNASPEGALVTKGWGSGASAQKSFRLGIVKDVSGNSLLSVTIWVTPATGTVAEAVTLTAPTRIDPSKWVRLGASYKPSEGLRLFINGQLVASRAETRSIMDISSTGTIWVGGGMSATSTRGYLGAVDDLWISNGSCGDLTGVAEVVPEKEQVIRSLDIVNNDRAQSRFDQTLPASVTGRGPWTFAHLMEQMVPATPSNPQLAQAAAADMVKRMFQTWAANSQVNGIPTTERSAIAAVGANWPVIPGTTTLDLARAPVRLLAIVNRTDLQNLNQGKAGEGRFVFGVMDPTSGGAMSFTIIFEYVLPALTDADIRKWAAEWHALGTLDPATDAYKLKLEALTNRFTLRGAAPSRVNGNAISQIRTNEISSGLPWELREFHLVNEAGLPTLKPSVTVLSPANDPSTATGTTTTNFNNTATLKAYVDGQQAAILNEQHTVPDTFNSQPFATGASLNNGGFWKIGDANLTTRPLVRHKFAVNTCNGCHSGAETSTGFLHVGTRGTSTVSSLSAFMTGGFSGSAPATFRKVDMSDSFDTLIANGVVPVFQKRDPGLQEAGVAQTQANSNKFADLARRANTTFKLLSCPVGGASATSARSSTLLKTTSVASATATPTAVPTSTSSLTTTVTSVTPGTSKLPAPIGRVH